MKVIILLTFVVVCQVQSATECPTGATDCAEDTCPNIEDCDGNIQPAHTDCNCCAYCQQYVGHGEQCYSKYGTELRCDDEFATCSPESKTCIRGNKCGDGKSCEMVTSSDCSKDGMELLERDPSKCRCCAMCGHRTYADRYDSCGAGAECNRDTGVCEGGID